MEEKQDSESDPRSSQSSREDTPRFKKCLKYFFKFYNQGMKIKQPLCLGG
jgi:hypothetical protein